MAIRTRGDFFSGVDVGVRTEELARTSRLVVAPDRLRGPVQQGRRRAQRVRARVGHPPARRARGSGDLRDHRRRRPSGRRPRRSCSASTPAGTRSPTPSTKMGLHLQGDALEPGVRPVQGAGRPQGRDHRGRPRGDRRRGARHRRRAPLLDRRARLPRWHAAPADRRPSCSRTATRARRSRRTASGNGMIDAAFAAIAAATGVDEHGRRLQGGGGHRRR